MHPPSRRSFADPISQPGRRLQVCEPRIALSASLAADLLLSSLDPELTGGQADSNWMLEQAEAVRQRYGLDGAGQTIAVIDSGAAWDHAALGGGFGPGYRVVGGWDFAEHDADPYDDGPAGFHGTHVAGLIAGQADGFSGIATGADLVALRVFDDFGKGSLDRIEAALQWVHTHRDALAHPITTVNLSLGALLSEATSGEVRGQLEDELQLLHSDGIVVVAAAGNQFDPTSPHQIHYPAASPWVAAVGSLDTGSGGLSSFSQRESGILVAPGHNVRSSVPDHVLGWDGQVDDFVAAAGTSMAAPQVAGAAALVRQAMVAAGNDASPATIVQHLHDTATTEIDQVTGIAYHVVDLQRAIESLLSRSSDGQHDGGPPTDPPATDDPADGEAADPTTETHPLGTISGLQTTLEADRWYQLQPGRSGILSLRWQGESPAEAMLCDVHGTPLAPLEGSAAAQTDFVVAAGQSLWIRLRGDGDYAVQMVNLLSTEEGRLVVGGTDGSDTVRLDLTDGIQIDIHGARYTADTARAAGWNVATGAPLAITIDGGGGSDTLQVIGSGDAERLVLRAAATASQVPGELTSDRITAQLRGFETVHFSGGGGPDRATLFDTPAADTLHAYPGQAQLTGVGYAMTIDQVPRIYVHATGGGEDTAFLYDSADDDTLAVRPQFTSLRSSDHFSLAYGFERVYAYATAGGNDRADLYDSTGDDQMTAAPTAAWISGSGYYASARHFETVVGHATAGGHDRAALYAQADAATWTRTTDLVQMNEAGGLLRAARGFEQTNAFLAGQRIEVAPLVWSPAAAETPTEASSLADQQLSPAGDLHKPGGNDEHHGDLRRREAAILAELFARFGADG